MKNKISYCHCGDKCPFPPRTISARKYISFGNSKWIYNVFFFWFLNLRVKRLNNSNVRTQKKYSQVQILIIFRLIFLVPISNLALHNWLFVLCYKIIYFFLFSIDSWSRVTVWWFLNTRIQRKYVFIKNWKFEKKYF